MSLDNNRSISFKNDILYLGNKTVFCVLETPIRLMSRYIECIDLKATPEEKKELYAWINDFLHHQVEIKPPLE